MANTDLEKLLFLFCQSTEDFYSFFPYKYGPFSFLSYYDKRKLTDNGFLREVNHFELAPSKSYTALLKATDRKKLQAFYFRTREYRGKRLIKQVYLQYPQYASRSEITEKTLSPQELQTAQLSWNKNEESMLFTIGYEGSSIDEYLHRLIRNNVKTIIDVRMNPVSRKYGFAKKRFQSYLSKANINYVHIPELGIPSSLRRELGDQESYQLLFEHYENELLPVQGDSLARIAGFVSEEGRVALTCFEADHCMCHRHKITKALQSNSRNNFPIRHI